MPFDVERIKKNVRILQKILKKAPKRMSPDEIHRLRTKARRLESILEALSRDLKESERRLANVWVAGPVARLTENALFPALETAYPEPAAVSPTVAEQFRPGNRLIAQLVAGVRRVRDQLAQEDVGLGIDGVHHQVQQFGHFGLKRPGFG